MPTLADAFEGAEILKARLQSTLDTADFAEAVQVLLIKDSQATVSYDAVPKVLLTLQDDSDGDDDWGHPFRKAVFEVEVAVTDFNGAISGLQATVSKELSKYFEENYTTLRDLGLYGNSIDRARETSSKVQNGRRVYSISHRITWYYHTS